MVVNKAERVTDVSLEIDDGTGRIDCTKWYFLIEIYHLCDLCFHLAVMYVSMLFLWYTER